MALTITEWKRVVAKKFLRSDEFRKLDDAVSDFLHGVNGHDAIAQKERKRKKANVKVAFDAWLAKLARSGKTYKTSARYFDGCALEDLAKIEVEVDDFGEVIDGKTDRRTLPDIFVPESLAVMKANFLREQKHNFHQGEILAKGKTVSGVINSALNSSASPPWVQIGNVFVSLVTAGSGSWKWLPNQFPDHGFSIFAGRHGNIVNPVTANGFLSAESFGVDAAKGVDIGLDRECAVQSSNGRKRSINVIDVGECGGVNASGVGLRGMINRMTDRDTFVVLAWCYGLFTFVESKNVAAAQADVSSPNNLLHQQWLDAMTARVCDVVARDWAWVKPC